ncbi:Ppx/GppA phosphatase family protein [Microlunatus parietis]|uniref:Exopolyphosphatase/guanosine-5'-triphosphate, 3'-diphosphate pyrophosphatase n=1 Tax=Microlunatus parietis TaxID=682979 RepID=A0A7Y9LAC2_9ACTN|nr:Ppx/GppA phosphatase family protein [Microlunatus parietis]NYE70502.1 exopolyphosphatase/guanosine-5'-triphosphate,3'-diphosphate pyrophosphatase [Microlunatus parietis]
MTRVAAVDCGTNSIRLLIAERGPDGRLVELERRTDIVRLGQGVDATGEFHPDALARTFAATEGYALLIKDAGVPADKIDFVATSAARDAGNREAFFTGIEERLGVRPEIISGDREAELSFTGALSGMAGGGPGPVLVMDIGGGSTELILGELDGTILAARSLDVGSVRLTERFLGAGPPAPDDLGRAAAYVDGLIDASGIDLGAARVWVGVAGTATTLAAVNLGLTAYDRSKVHGSIITVDALAGLLADLSAKTVEEIRAIPSMHPGRADVICGGTLVASRVARRVSTDRMVVSEADILDGIALSLLS